MKYITLTTDFGLDGSHAVMHGVIYNICPDAKIINLSHEIKSQDIYQASYIIDINVWYFPENTVHIIVVDPGVGTGRRPIAAQIGKQRFVAPDNGVLTRVYERAEKACWPIHIHHASKPEYWLDRVSNIFHGRDIFSPVGAHLAARVPLEMLGPEIDDPIRIEIPRPRAIAGGLEAEIILIDKFGNIHVNIEPSDVEEYEDLSVEICGHTIDGMVNTFGDSEYDSDTLITLWDSNWHLMVSENNGTGGKVIQPRIGDKVIVRPFSK